jgi:hypothetical protein
VGVDPSDLEHNRVRKHGTSLQVEGLMPRWLVLLP